MDIATALWLEAEANDCFWEAYCGRDYSERDWVRDFYDVCEMFDGNENAWDAVERRERMAQVEYEE
tara:strand:+ start:2657 stop:2854 length:198 start_codon:yes stop_codon:yes gene_type:complete